MLSNSVKRAYKRFAAVTQDGVKLDFSVHMGSMKKNGKKTSVRLAEVTDSIHSRTSIKNSKSTKTKTQTANTTVDAILTTPGTADDKKSLAAQTNRSKVLEKRESMNADVDSILKSGNS